MLLWHHDSLIAPATLSEIDEVFVVAARADVVCNGQHVDLRTERHVSLRKESPLRF